ncbi:MAG: beta-galactosidase, partial [Brachybacterium sp.]|nr:beta-galactosidase [Brachybacterium sp.]
MRTDPWRDQVGFGAAYYHEYHLSPRLETDMDLMAEAGFTLIRVGESVWSTWEPAEGQFDLDWLEPVLDAAHARGIDVIVGTPTYAVPPWLRRAYPETALELATGVPKPYGGRQDVNYHHPTFRRLAERVIRRIVERYREHPAVVGWQVDNEPGLALIHNDDVFEGYVDDLRKRFGGDVEELNRRWGLVYWSHRLQDFGDLWRPEGNTTPSYDLAWRRWQAEVSHDMIRWQTDLVRSLVPAEHLITTCIAANQPGQDVSVIADPLDIAGANVYYAAQAGLELPGPDDLHPMGAPAWVTWSGAAYVSYLADVARGMKQGPFVVTETNATNIGFSADQLPSWPGQRRQVVWQLLARGARMVEYWHWHTNRFGAETYWSGVLGHSLEPARTYRELAAVGEELKELGDLACSLETLSEVTVLVDAPSRWALENQPPFHPSDVATYTGDRDAFEKMLAQTYRGLFDAGLGVDIAALHQLSTNLAEIARTRPVLVAQSMYIASDEDLELLRAYAEAGGHLVLLPRTGIADTDAVVRAEVMPGALRGPAQVRYEESTALRAATSVVSAPGAEESGLRGHALWYADCLIPEGAEVLARFDADPFLAEHAAITTSRHGTGRITVVGCVPDRSLAASLGRFLAATSLEEDPWR